MKRNFLKILISAAVALLLVAALSVGALASPTVKVTYVYDGSIQNAIVDSGKSFVPMTPALDASEDSYFYGWADEKGNVYTAGKSISLSKDTTLYALRGTDVKNSAELFAALESGNNCIKLTSDISLSEAINLENGVYAIDTNGFTLSINAAGAGIKGKGTGITFIGGGKVVHNDKDAVAGLVLTGLIELNPTTSFETFFVNVAKGASLETNVNLISIPTNIDRHPGTFSASIYGSVDCDKLMRTQGISEAEFAVYTGATVTMDGEFFFEDISSTKSTRLVNMSISGGTFNFSGFNGVGKDKTKYQCAITGGSFSEDISSRFTAGNYSFVLKVSTGYYDFFSCTHNGAIVSGMPATCTEAATISYKCDYCNKEYTKDFPNGIGHTMVTAIEQPLITTEEVTQAGVYKHYCQKCDEMTTYESFYPRPDEVYVTVIILDQKNREKTLRVPAKEIFEIKYEGEKATALIFNTLYIEAQYEVTQDHIISVEIPLGTTDIYGDWPSNSDHGVGLFCKNQHLQEVVIPESVVNIGKCSFRYMAKLKTIKGLEHVTGSIGEYAFCQLHTDALIDQMVVNASSISRYAFENIRMNSLRIGANVSNIAGGAFKLASGAEAVKEVFIDGFENFNVQGPISVSYCFENYVKNKSYSTSEQQYGSRSVVYPDHQYNITVHKADCYGGGYTHYDCKYCGYEKIGDRTLPLSHEFKNVHIAPTCLTQGYTVDKCNNCGEEIAGTKVVFEKRDPNAHSFTAGTTTIYVNLATNQISESGSVCESYHCVVNKCACGQYDKKALESATLISPLGAHAFDEEHMTVVVKPNCGQRGVGKFSCTVCDKEVEIQLPTTGEKHKSNTGTVTKQPTCVANGVTEFHCTVCGTLMKTSNVPKKNPNVPEYHLLDSGVVAKAPTETETGVKLFTCTLCRDYTKTEGIDPLGLSQGLPTGAIVGIVIGAVLLAAGIVLTLYFTLFKKKRASDNYKYNFNTLGK